MHVAVGEMTVIKDRDVTVPHAAWSGENEAACICYKCHRLDYLAMPTPTTKLSLLFFLGL